MSHFIALALAALVDVMTPGAYVEQHEVRLTHLRRCLSIRCTSMVYTVNYVERSCLAPGSRQRAA